MSERTTQRAMVEAAREYLRRSDSADFITIKDLAIERGLNKISLQRYSHRSSSRKVGKIINKCLSDAAERALNAEQR